MGLIMEYLQYWPEYCVIALLFYVTALIAEDVDKWQEAGWFLLSASVWPLIVCNRILYGSEK